MSNEPEKWEITKILVYNFILAVLVMGWNGAVVCMLLQGRIDEVNAVVWGIYGVVMSAFGIPIAYSGISKIRGK